MIYVDGVIFVAVWLIAQYVFRGYEVHVPYGKRLIKLAVMLAVFLAIHLLAGRICFYGTLVLASVSIAALHGYWFHYRHGIHWRTAEPRDKYLRLIGKLK